MERINYFRLRRRTKANSLRAKFATVVAGRTKTAFDIAGFQPSEREKNVIADIPVKYGRTPKYRFIKGEEDKDLRRWENYKLLMRNTI